MANKDSTRLDWKNHLPATLNEKRSYSAAEYRLMLQFRKPVWKSLNSLHSTHLPNSTNLTNGQPPADDDDSNRTSRLSAVRLPELSPSNSLTVSLRQISQEDKNCSDTISDAITREKKSAINGITKAEEEEESKGVVMDERSKAQVKKKSSQRLRKKAPVYLPKTAERLSTLQKTYGITVVPDRVLFGTRMESQSKLRRTCSSKNRPSSCGPKEIQKAPSVAEIECKKKRYRLHEVEQCNTAITHDKQSQAVRSIQINVQSALDKLNEKQLSADDHDVSVDESSVSLPHSGCSDDSDYHSCVKRIQRKKKKKKKKKDLSTTRRYDQIEPVVEQETRPEEDIVPALKKSVKRGKKRPSTRSYKTVKNVPFFLRKGNLLKPLFDPKLIRHERLLVDYYNKCQSYLFAEPEASTGSSFCNNVNNNYSEVRNKYGGDNASRQTGQEEDYNKFDSFLKKRQKRIEKPNPNSLNSLEDFDAFFAKSVVERISKSRKSRARVRRLLEHEYLKRCCGSRNSFPDKEDSGGALGFVNNNNDSNGHEADNDFCDLSICSNEFSYCSDIQAPLNENIENFDDFVAKTIRNHLHRQTLLHKKKKRRNKLHSFNNYDKWLRRRIFGYYSNKHNKGSNVSNNVKKFEFKNQKSSGQYTTQPLKPNRHDNADDVRPPDIITDLASLMRKRSEPPKKWTIDDLKSAMKYINEKIVSVQHDATERELTECEDLSKRAEHEGWRNSLKGISRTESLPQLSIAQERRAHALGKCVERSLNAPLVYRTYQLFSGIPFTMPRQVFHFTDMDKVSKFQSTVRHFTGQDYILLNSIKAMTDINTRILRMYKESTDRHKERLKEMEYKRKETLIREGLLERDFDELEQKREKRHLRRMCHRQNILRQFSGNPMRKKYNMASKSMKMMDELNVSESYARLLRKLHRPDHKEKLCLKNVEYQSRLQSDSSKTKKIIDIRGETMNKLYNATNKAFQYMFHQKELSDYRSEQNQGLGTFTAVSDISDEKTNVSKGIFDKFHDSKGSSIHISNMGSEKKQKRGTDKLISDDTTDLTLPELPSFGSDNYPSVYIKVPVDGPPPPHWEAAADAVAESQDKAPGTPSTQSLTNEIGGSDAELGVGKGLPDKDDTAADIAKMIDDLLGEFEEEEKRKELKKSSSRVSTRKSRKSSVKKKQLDNAVNEKKKKLVKIKKSEKQEEEQPMLINRLGMKSASSQPGSLGSQLLPIAERSSSAVSSRWGQRSGHKSSKTAAVWLVPSETPGTKSCKDQETKGDVECGIRATDASVKSVNVKENNFQAVKVLLDRKTAKKKKKKVKTSSTG